MHYDTRTRAKRSITITEMAQYIPFHLPHASGSTAENFVPQISILPEIAPVQQTGRPFEDFQFHPDDLIPRHGATNPMSLPSHFPQSGNICSRPSTFCTSLHTSSPSLAENLPQMHSITFLPHPQRSEHPVPLTPMFLPSMGLLYQPNRATHLNELLQTPTMLNGDFFAGNKNSIQVNTAEPDGWQVESGQINLIISSEDNPRMDEICGLPQDSCFTLKSKDYQMDRNVTSPIEELFEINPSTFGSDSVIKSRMRWTEELHDCFVQAINDLGGPDSATPKSIVAKMNVKGLTKFHVKSHLQKYRLARYRPESKEDKRSACSEGKKRSTIDEENMAPIKAVDDSEALRQRWELQKNLHDQLEFQKALQLQAEENARRLQKLLDEQKKVGEAFMQAIQPPPPPPTAEFQVGVSTQHDKLTTSENESSELQLLSPSPKRARLDDTTVGWTSQESPTLQQL
ncbi:protein PHOSPHATE STARVATION RESPONSE 3-like isoform X2 [Tasmannia lanceolata]|uniref:protein PHOSPHATE STARVATION RESPONSE 3-like isoform X2 n=1 Tax=Tasmannia lanceolata TaxID=3420 RepID=UPI0040648BFA